MTNMVDIGLYILFSICLVFSIRYIIEDYGRPATDAKSAATAAAQARLLWSAREAARYY